MRAANPANLTTTIDITLNLSRATDGHLSASDLTQVEPIAERCCSIQLIDTSHGTCKDVTTLGMFQSIYIVVIGIFYQLKFCVWYVIAGLQRGQTRSICVDRNINILMVITNSTATDGNRDVTISTRSLHIAERIGLFYRTSSGIGCCSQV